MGEGTFLVNLAVKFKTHLHRVAAEITDTAFVR